ncbi:hypothetical protein GLW00_06640 [Halobacillus litoralis]|uniref:Uncharacterized protein n=1 Tax=Halobacillus litoralis TaxID=45668 RepID=A0A845FA61_9BACI|nr:hypothetical protein [Halobacillus litoralis]MYL70517.1 hypothetical protein [Halobacillus litoralis]
MNWKKAVLLFIGVLFGLVVTDMFTHSGFDSGQLLLTIVGGSLGYSLVLLFLSKRQGKRY